MHHSGRREQGRYSQVVRDRDEEDPGKGRRFCLIRNHPPAKGVCVEEVWGGAGESERKDEHKKVNGAGQSSERRCGPSMRSDEREAKRSGPKTRSATEGQKKKPKAGTATPPKKEKK